MENMPVPGWLLVVVASAMTLFAFASVAAPIAGRFVAPWYPRLAEALIRLGSDIKGARQAQGLPVDTPSISAVPLARMTASSRPPPPSGANGAVPTDGQSVVPPAIMLPRRSAKLPPWSGGAVFCLLLAGCVPILGCQMTPAQTGKVIEASVDAGLELADHVCEASGRHSGFVEFLCTFVGALTEDTGKGDMVELGPARKPIKVSVPDAMAEDFGRRHSAEQLARSDGGM